ncbi:MAG: glycosyltransferase [bacterium]|nr:glycosyltransferase [bacterium]
MQYETLLLFTRRYPYILAGEKAFLDPELKSLSTVFKHIIVLPEYVDNMIEPERICENVEVNTDFSTYLHHKPSFNLLRKIETVFRSSLFYHEIYHHPQIYRYPKTLYPLLFSVVGAHLTQMWIETFISKERITPQSCMLYTYWLNWIAAGIACVKKKNPVITAFSRAHEYEIYCHQYNTSHYLPQYLPLRDEAMRYLDRVFFDSNDGRQYMAAQYPRFASKCEVAPMGVFDPGFRTEASQDEIARIMSCSFLTHQKRVERLVQGLAQLGKRHPQKRFEWYHIGDGELRQDIETSVRNLLPPNVTAFLLGYLPNDQQIAFYKKHALDVFINVSVSEGRPVSIMEAQSCAIPVIATAVGGNPEMVTAKNGALLSKNPSPAEIASALESIVLYPEVRQQKAELSRENWKTHLDASINYRLFAEKIQTLITL